MLGLRHVLTQTLHGIGVLFAGSMGWQSYGSPTSPVMSLREPPLGLERGWLSVRPNIRHDHLHRPRLDGDFQVALTAGELSLGSSYRSYKLG